MRGNFPVRQQQTTVVRLLVPVYNPRNRPLPRPCIRLLARLTRRRLHHSQHPNMSRRAPRPLVPPQRLRVLWCLPITRTVHTKIRQNPKSERRACSIPWHCSRDDAVDRMRCLPRTRQRGELRRRLRHGKSLWLLLALIACRRTLIQE